MDFEHLVQINDPQLRQVEFLSREQLWLGLVAKAYRPEQFNVALEHTEILHEKVREGVTFLDRRIDFGNFSFVDCIELHDQHQTINHIPATDFCGQSCLTIQIEEPRPQEFWLRFQYVIHDLAGQGDAQCSQDEVDEARKQAYQALDI
ncbi:MAG: AtaL-like protein, partial [Limnobacter sp.]|nr:AtaL-like protein [Limnobacter sp.]